MLSAILRDTSWLRTVLSGRITAGLTSLVAATLAVPTVGAFLLLARDYERLLIAATVAIVAMTFLVVKRITQRHVTPIYGICLVAPATTLVTGLAMASVTVVIAYSSDVNIAFGSGETLSEALMRNRAEIEGTIPVIEPVVMLFLVGDVTANWLLARGGYAAALPLALYLLSGAAAYLGVARVAVDIQAAFESGRAKEIR